MSCEHSISVPENPTITFLAWDEIEIYVDDVCEECGVILSHQKVIYKR